MASGAFYVETFCKILNIRGIYHTKKDLKSQMTTSLPKAKAIDLIDLIILLGRQLADVPRGHNTPKKKNLVMYNNYITI